MSRKYRNRPTRDYTVLRNAALRNTALSLKAKGCLALMLTFPDDWEYHLDHLEGMSRDGRDALRAAIRELESHGYITRIQTRKPDGTLGDSEYHVTDDVRTVDGKTVAGLSVAGKTVAGKPAAKKTDYTKTEITKTEKTDPKKKRGHEFDPETVALPEKFDRDHFVAFCEVRLKKNSPMTAYALRLFLKKHGELPKAELDVRFEKAIVAGWKDLYPVDGNRNAARATEAGTRVYEDVTGAELLEATTWN